MSDHLEPDEPDVGPDVDPDVVHDAAPDPDRVLDEPEDDEPRRYPSTIGGACYLAVLITAALAIGVCVAGDWRVGLRLLGASLAAAGLARLVLPLRDAGMLAVRHRPTDVLMLGGIAVTLWWLAGSIPDQP